MWYPQSDNVMAYYETEIVRNVNKMARKMNYNVFIIFENYRYNLLIYDVYLKIT